MCCWSGVSGANIAHEGSIQCHARQFSGVVPTTMATNHPDRPDGPKLATVSQGSLLSMFHNGAEVENNGADILFWELRHEGWVK